MVDDIPMGNALFTIFFFSPIEIIPFLVRQMFGVIERKMNDQITQQTVDKIETRKKQTVLMAEFRILILVSAKIPPTLTATPVFPAPFIIPFAVPIFTPTIERRKIFPEFFLYHGDKKDFQPWYFQIKMKLQMDFIYLSGRDRFFYIHNKLKNKILNQMQTWVKTMTERGNFSNQIFFNQLMLIYDNPQSMEIAAKKLNKMKQGRSFRGLKKKLETN